MKLRGSIAWILGAAGLCGACLPVYAPRTRPGVHHASVSADTPDGLCVGCHEPEQEAAERLSGLTATAREGEMDRMKVDGAALVAQWMIDDARSCVTCHPTRGGSR